MDVEELFESKLFKGDFSDDPYTHIHEVDCPSEEILLYIVHGIGQNKEKLIHSLNKIKASLKTLYAKNKSILDKQVHLRIIDWKHFVNVGSLSKLHDRNNNVSYPKEFIGKAPTDLIYYMGSNKHNIMNAVIEQMNEYTNLVRRFRPLFNESISIIGHSLGSVIMYEILISMYVKSDKESTLPSLLKNQSAIGSNIDQEYLLSYDDSEKKCLKTTVNYEISSKMIKNDQNLSDSFLSDLKFLKAKKIISLDAQFSKEKNLLLTQSTRNNRRASSLFKDISYLDCQKTILSSNENIRPLKFMIDHLFFIGSPLSLFLTIDNGDNVSLKIMPTVKDFHNIIHPMDPVAYRIEPIIKNYPKVPHSFVLPHWENDGYRKPFLRSVLQVLGIEKKNNDYLNHDNLIGRKRYDFMVQESPLEKTIHIVGFLFSHQAYWNNADVFYFILKMCHWQGYSGVIS